jgi:hypothetical protein
MEGKLSTGWASASFVYGFDLAKVRIVDVSEAFRGEEVSAKSLDEVLCVLQNHRIRRCTPNAI